MQDKYGRKVAPIRPKTKQPKVRTRSKRDKVKGFLAFGQMRSALGLLLLATNVAGQRCPVLVPPANAETTCSITSSGQEICQIFCTENYTFASTANNQFSCEKGKK